MARSIMEFLGEFAAVADHAVSVAPAVAVDPRETRHLLLKRVFESHCLLDIRLPPGAEAYQSAILELVPEHGYLVLDALAPASGNAVAATLPPVQVRARLQGMDLKFATRIIQYGSQGGLPYYQAHYPDAIDFPQRRREYRVAIPLDRGVNVRFHLRDGSCVRGEVRDLSANGFCARVLAGDIAKLVGSSGEFERCEIDLPGHDTLRAQVEVRHLLSSRARSAPRVGACFVDLDPRSERQLEHCVAELNRKRLHLT